MQTDPIRWICGICFTIVRIRLRTHYRSGKYNNPDAGDAVHIRLPICCGQEMLLAGEPKLDVHGLREKGTWIDPVDNIIPPTVKLATVQLRFQRLG